MQCVLVIPNSPIYLTITIYSLLFTVHLHLTLSLSLPQTMTIPLQLKKRKKEKQREPKHFSVVAMRHVGEEDQNLTDAQLSVPPWPPRIVLISHPINYTQCSQ